MANEYRVELRRVTEDAKQLCPMKMNTKSRMVERMVNSSVSTHFSNLYEFSIYNVTIFAIDIMTTSTAAVDFTTKAAGTDVMMLCYTLC